MVTKIKYKNNKILKNKNKNYKKMKTYIKSKNIINKKLKQY